MKQHGALPVVGGKFADTEGGFAKRDERTGFNGAQRVGAWQSGGVAGRSLRWY
jgi:hypothetical protein